MGLEEKANKWDGCDILVDGQDVSLTNFSTGEISNYKMMNATLLNLLGDSVADKMEADARAVLMKNGEYIDLNLVAGEDFTERQMRKVVDASEKVASLSGYGKLGLDENIGRPYQEWLEDLGFVEDQVHGKSYFVKYLE